MGLTAGWISSLCCRTNDTNLSTNTNPWLLLPCGVGQMWLVCPAVLSLGWTPALDWTYLGHCRGVTLHPARLPLPKASRLAWTCLLMVVAASQKASGGPVLRLWPWGLDLTAGLETWAALWHFRLGSSRHLRGACALRLPTWGASMSKESRLVPVPSFN